MTKFTIGSDPECFIVNDKKKVISSIGLIPGEKGNPYRPEDLPEGFGLETDNILAEFNIPASDLFVGEIFVNNMLTMKEWLKNFLKEKNSTYDVLCQASAIIDEDQLQSKEAQEIGCMVDYNVYTERPNKKPKKFEDNIRTTGRMNAIRYRNIA